MFVFFLSFVSLSCSAKKEIASKRALVHDPHMVSTPKVKPMDREEKVRSINEAMILVVPESVRSVTLTKCTRARKAVRLNQVRFFDIPSKSCRVRFSPSGLFTSVAGGVGVHYCRVLTNNSSVICTLSLDGLNSVPGYQ